MELIQQLEEWQRQLDGAPDATHADLDVARRLVKHGADALREIKRLRASIGAIHCRAALSPRTSALNAVLSECEHAIPELATLTPNDSFRATSAEGAKVAPGRDRKSVV